MGAACSAHVGYEKFVPRIYRIIEGKRPLEMIRCRREDTIKTELREIE